MPCGGLWPAATRGALLVRAIPLAQAAVTFGLGAGVYRRVWLGVAAAVVAAGWCAVLAVAVWRRGDGGTLPHLADGLVAATVLVVAGAATPAPLLTTSFYWAATLAAATALLVGLTLPRWAGGAVLVLLVCVYGVVVERGAGMSALAAAAGNGAGMVLYFGAGVGVAVLVHRLGARLARTDDEAARREEQLGIQRVRLEEFGRLHDEAVQVLEVAAGGVETDVARLRAFASRAAAHLRSAIDSADPPTGGLTGAFARVAARFSTIGFTVAVGYEGALAALPDAASEVLTGAATEALNNVYKHSGCDRAWLRVRDRGFGVEVVVEDRGRGFDLGVVRAGFGIERSMRARMAGVGGTVEVSSAPGAGTRVSLWLPR